MHTSYDLLKKWFNTPTTFPTSCHIWNKVTKYLALVDAKLGAAVGEQGRNVFAEHLGKDSGLESVGFILHIITTINKHILFATVAVEVAVQNYLSLTGQPGRRDAQRNM